MKSFKLLDVDFKVPDEYQKSSEKRVILVESENSTREINLDDNDNEPTIKLSDGAVLFKGSDTNVSLDETAKSISTHEKYTDGSKEFFFLVRKFTNPKQVCRALKGEVQKYNNVIKDDSIDGYRANLGDGNHLLCTVQRQSLIIIKTNDIGNLESVFQKETNKWGLAELIFGVAMILFGLFALIKLGFSFRILFLWGIATYFLYGGYGNMSRKGNDCPKFNIQ